MTRLAFEIVLATIIAIGPHVVSSVFNILRLSDGYTYSPNPHTVILYTGIEKL